MTQENGDIAIAAVLCGLICWYSGKGFFPRAATRPPVPTTESIGKRAGQ